MAFIIWQQGKKIIAIILEIDAATVSYLAPKAHPCSFMSDRKTAGSD
jgi:hypothetical protein